MRQSALPEPLWQPWPALAEQVEFTHFYRRGRGLKGSVTHCLVSVQTGAQHIHSTSPSALPTISPSLLTHSSPMFTHPLSENYTKMSEEDWKQRYIHSSVGTQGIFSIWLVRN